MAQTMEVSGVKYERDTNIEHWVKVDLPDEWDGSHVPHVICGGCERTVFSLFYGDYELFAVCTTCALTATVYSG